MSDVPHAKFISPYHSNGEETEIPDLFYRYSQQFVNVYSRNEKNIISSVTTDDLGNIASEQHLTIQYVLEATFRKKPILVIATTASKSMNVFTKSRIYIFLHQILENDTKMIHFDLPMVGDISAIAMTSQPLVLVQKSTREISKQEHVKHLIAFGKRDRYIQIALLHDVGTLDKRIRGQVAEVELSSQAPGHITAIDILPQSTEDMRLGFGDPRIFVGTSGGYIQVLRFQALFKKQTLDGIHILQGLKWTDMMTDDNKPITYLTCKRAGGIHKVVAAVAREHSLSNGDGDGDDDDSAHDNNESNDINGNDKKINSNASLWVIEWPGNNHRKILDQLSPTKLTSFTLSSTRIIPTLQGYQVTAIFQSTEDKQHFEVDVWTIENGKVKLVISDEIFGEDNAHAPEDIWPLNQTSGYMLLDYESYPTEVNITNTDITSPSPEANGKDELSKEYDMDQALNGTDGLETSDPTSAYTQDNDDENNITTDDQKETAMKQSDSTLTTDDEVENSSGILTIPSEYDEKEISAGNEDQTATTDGDNFNHSDNTAPFPQNGDDEQTKRLLVDRSDSLQDQSMDDEGGPKGGIGNPYHVSYQDSDEQQRYTGLDDNADQSDANNVTIFNDNNKTLNDNNETLSDDNEASEEGSLDANTVTTNDDNDEFKDNGIDDVHHLNDQNHKPISDTQHEPVTITQGKLENNTNIVDVSIGYMDDEQGKIIEQKSPDSHDASENNNDSHGTEKRDLITKQGNPAIVEIDDPVVSEATATICDSGTASNGHDHDINKISINSGAHSIVTKDDDTTITYDVANNDILEFDDDIRNGDLAQSGATSVVNQSMSPEQTIINTLSPAATSMINRNEENLLDDTTHDICKLEQNITGLGSNNNFDATLETTPLSALEHRDIKQPPTSPIICMRTKEKEPPTPKMLYTAKVKKVTESSLSDGLDMVREDDTVEFNQQERLWVLFDIIFSMATMTTSAATKSLDINKAMKAFESLPLESQEQDWLMNYCFTNENELLKLLIMRYNIEHGNFGLVMMQHKTMKFMENTRNQLNNHAQSSQITEDEDSLDRVTKDIERTCKNLAKLSQGMVPSVLQDLPLEIFGQKRGKVGNPFLNESKPSLLQEKGLGLGGELLLQVMESRKRRRLD